MQSTQSTRLKLWKGRQARDEWMSGGNRLAGQINLFQNRPEATGMWSEEKWKMKGEFPVAHSSPRVSLWFQSSINRREIIAAIRLKKICISRSAKIVGATFFLRCEKPVFLSSMETYYWLWPGGNICYRKIGSIWDRNSFRVRQMANFSPTRGWPRAKLDISCDHRTIISPRRGCCCKWL